MNTEKEMQEDVVQKTPILDSYQKRSWSISCICPTLPRSIATIWSTFALVSWLLLPTIG